MNLSPKDSRLACAAHVLTSRTTARLKCSLCYVDDLLVTGSSEVGISKTKAFLMTKFAMKDLGDVSLILGMQVSRDRLKGTLDINQGNHVKAILQRHEFVDSRSVSTPGTGKPLDLKL